MDSYVDKLLKDLDQRRLLAQDRFIVEIVARLCEYMERNNISRAELARKVGKDRSFVSQVLSGERNFQVRTLADMIYALGADLQFSLAESRRAHPLEEEVWETDIEAMSAYRQIPETETESEIITYFDGYRESKLAA